jgi:hypothetical protein
MITMEKRAMSKIHGVFKDSLSRFRTVYMYLLRHGPLASLHVRMLALHFCTGSTYCRLSISSRFGTMAAKHKEVRERSNRSYGYAFTPGILPSTPSGPASFCFAVQNRSRRFCRSRAAPTNTNPARRTGRSNAAEPTDGRERPTPAILLRNAD